MSRDLVSRSPLRLVGGRGVDLVLRCGSCSIRRGVPRGSFDSHDTLGQASIENSSRQGKIFHDGNGVKFNCDTVKNTNTMQKSRARYPHRAC